MAERFPWDPAAPPCAVINRADLLGAAAARYARGVQACGRALREATVPPDGGARERRTEKVFTDLGRLALDLDECRRAAVPDDTDPPPPGPGWTYLLGARASSDSHAPCLEVALWAAGLLREFPPVLFSPRGVWPDLGFSSYLAPRIGVTVAKYIATVRPAALAAIAREDAMRIPPEVRARARVIRDDCLRRGDGAAASLAVLRSWLDFDPAAPHAAAAPAAPCPYAALGRAAPGLRLKGKQLATVDAIVAAGGPTPLSDLRLAAQWPGSVDDGWKNMANPLNKKLKRLGLKLRRHASNAEVVALKSS